MIGHLYDLKLVQREVTLSDILYGDIIISYLWIFSLLLYFNFRQQNGEKSSMSIYVL